MRRKSVVDGVEGLRRWCLAFTTSMLLSHQRAHLVALTPVQPQFCGGPPGATYIANSDVL